MRLLAFFALAVFAGSAIAQHGASASNMALVGHDDLQARSAYQPVIHQQGGRWIAYVGHHGGKAMNPLTGQRTRTTAPRSSTSPIRARRAISRTSPASRARAKPAARRWCACATAPTCRRRDQSKVYLLRTLRQPRARDLGRHRAAEALAHHRGRRQAQGHAQELVGVRHRHRLPRLGRRRTGARAA